MRRPTILHVARDWVRPSERFVSDTVATTTATRAVVACGRRWPGSPADAVRAPTVPLGPVADRVPPRIASRTVRAGLAAVAVAHRARVLHAHFGYWAPHVEAVARHLGLPWVVSLHGHDLLVQPRHDPAVLAAVRHADLVVVPSRFLGDQAVQRGVAADRLRVLPSGLDLAALPFRARRPADGRPTTIAFAGRFVDKKGVLDAVEALARVGARPGVQARFVGTGPLEPALRRRLDALGLDAEVLDGAPPGALRRALADTDLLLTPSRTADDGDAETLGLVNLEAQACGIPVVTTRHGGIPEAVAPDGAVLVDEGDVDGMVEALECLLDDPDRWGPMGRAGRAHVAARFELGARVADLEDQYRSLVATGRPAPEPPPPDTDLPRATVVMLTRDRQELVARTIDALERQTYPPDRLEVVVVDNASRDGTRQLLHDRAARWPALRVLAFDDHRTTSAARNAAAAAGTGEMVAFTDDDCRPRPTWLEALAAGILAGADVVQGRTTADPAQTVTPLSRTQWTPAEYGLYETANIAYRRATFEAVGGFDEELADEMAQHLLAIARYPFGEDTDLAWRGRRQGARTRFAATAVVDHHVFPPDVPYLLRRAAVAAGFPRLVRAVPELRTVFLHRRVFLGPHHERLLVALAGLALAPRDRRAVVLALPYLWGHVRPLRRGRRARARVVPVLVLRDLVEEAALVVGWVRGGRLVL